MKKVLLILLSSCSLLAFPQQKPKLAVYMTGDDPINEIVSNRLVDDFARSSEYTTVERTASFLAELSKEHNYERSGEVNDEQIAALGKQFNVQYVCVASVLDVWGNEKYITARIIDAETAEVIASGSTNGAILNSSQLIGALNTLSENFLKAMRNNKQSDAKKVAVYVIKTGNRDVDVVLGDQLVAGFAKSGRYAAIERTSGFLRKIKEEQGYQHSGAVADDDLTRWGQQFGVQYVCVVKTTSWAGDYFITTRMIDVKTGGLVNGYKVEGRRLSSSTDVVNVSQEIANELSKGTFAEQAYEAEQERQRQLEEQRLAEQRKKEYEEYKLQQQREREEYQKQLRINRDWRELCNTRIKTVSKKYDTGWSIGNGINGYGVFMWDDGDMYFGNYEEGWRQGIGMYVAKTGSLPYCGYGRVYVGDWKHNKMQGTGSIYDKNGKLIYDGKFLMGKPTGKCPMDGSMPKYTFEVINYENGDKYVGELMNGKRHGRGAYFWAEGNGVVWYGKWVDDQRNGYGIYIYDNGAKFSTGTWEKDSKVK